MIAVVVGSLPGPARAFRSLLVAAQAAVANVLSVAAAFGVLTACFQWGWGSSLIGLDTARGTEPIASYVPLMMFAVLFGLSMDYQVFLLSQVEHHRAERGEGRQSIAAGLATGARVIVAAALIMMTVFGSFILNGDPTVKQFGVVDARGGSTGCSASRHRRPGRAGGRAGGGPACARRRRAASLRPIHGAPRARLAGPDVIEALLAGGDADAEALGGFAIPSDWPDDHDARFIERRAKQMRENHEQQQWMVRAITLPEPHRRMIGHAGFHGPPGTNGLERAGAVEIGYTVFEEYRGRGYATETAGALLDWARDEHAVRHFIASVSPGNEASLAIVRKLGGFVETGRQWDEEDGEELVFELADVF